MADYSKWDELESSSDDEADFPADRNAENQEQMLELEALRRRADALFNVAEQGRRKVTGLDQSQGNYESALSTYTDLISAIGTWSIACTLPKDFAADLEISSCLNSACCCIRLEMWEKGVDFCDQALRCTASAAFTVPPETLLRAKYFKVHALMQSPLITEKASKASKEIKDIKKLLYSNPQVLDKRQRGEYEQLCDSVEASCYNTHGTNRDNDQTQALNKMDQQNHKQTKGTNMTAFTASTYRKCYTDEERKQFIKEMDLNVGASLIEERRFAEAVAWYTRLFAPDDATRKALLGACSEAQLAELHFGNATALQAVGSLKQVSGIFRNLGSW